MLSVAGERDNGIFLLGNEPETKQVAAHKEFKSTMKSFIVKTVS